MTARAPARKGKHRFRARCAARGRVPAPRGHRAEGVSGGGAGRSGTSYGAGRTKLLRRRVAPRGRDVCHDITALSPSFAVARSFTLLSPCSSRRGRSRCDLRPGPRGEGTDRSDHGAARSRGGADRAEGRTVRRGGPCGEVDRASLRSRVGPTRRVCPTDRVSPVTGRVPPTGCRPWTGRVPRTSARVIIRAASNGPAVRSPGEGGSPAEGPPPTRVTGPDLWQVAQSILTARRPGRAGAGRAFGAVGPAPGRGGCSTPERRVRWRGAGDSPGVHGRGGALWPSGMSGAGRGRAGNVPKALPGGRWGNQDESDVRQWQEPAASHPATGWKWPLACEGMAPPAGLEPAAKRLEGACSIH